MALYIDLDSVPSPSPSPGPSSARVWLGAASIDFSSGHNLGALATGLVINTAGVPSAVAHGTNGYVLTMVGGVPTWAVAAGGVTDHGALTGLSDDDHPQYVRVVTAGTGLSGGGSGGSLTVNLANTAVSPGSYTYASLTVDAQGRLTSASSGTAAGASVLGRSVSSAGAVAPILSGSDGQIMVRVAGAVNFGQLQAASAAGTTTDGFVLTLVSGVPTWQAATGGVTGSGAANRVALWSGASALTSDAGFTLSSGTLAYSASSSGSVVTQSVVNSSNTASSRARQLIEVGGGTAGDPFTEWNVSGGTRWVGGVANQTSDELRFGVGTDPAAINTQANGLVMAFRGAGDNVGFWDGRALFGTFDGIIAARTLSGQTMNVYMRNAGTSANSAVRYMLHVGSGAGGGSAGDAWTQYQIDSVTDWCTGIDNSVSSPEADPYVISRSTALGTNDVARFWSFGIELPPRTAPTSNPGTGSNFIYTDTADGRVKILDSTGMVTVLN